MEFQTEIVGHNFFAKEQKKSISLSANDTHIEVRLDGKYTSSLSFDNLYSLLENKPVYQALLNELTAKNDLINKLIKEREDDAIKASNKINLGEIYIPEFYNQPYCLINSNRLYLCPDGTFQKSGIKDYPYYHDSYAALIELLEKHYNYTLEK